MIGKAIGWGLGIVLVAGVVGVGASFMGVVGSVVTAPGRVISKTLETDNIITSYEWYYDTWKAFDARVAQIKGNLSSMNAAKQAGADFSSLDRYRVETDGMRQSCRDMAAKYNANVSKINKAIFRGRDAPESLDPSACEVQA